MARKPKTAHDEGHGGGQDGVTPAKPSSAPIPAADGREERLADALRANLRRRKARARQEPAGEAAAAGGTTPDHTPLASDPASEV